MTDVMLNPPNTEPPMEEVMVFVSRDENGLENVCGMSTPLGVIPMMTGNINIMTKILMPTAQRMAVEAKRNGIKKTIHLLRFSKREEVMAIG